MVDALVLIVNHRTTVGLTVGNNCGTLQASIKTLQWQHEQILKKTHFTYRQLIQAQSELASTIAQGHLKFTNKPFFI